MFDVWQERLNRLKARLLFIAAHRFRARHELPTFSITGAPPADPTDPAPVPLPYHTYWGEWDRDFTLRGSYRIPEGWPLDAPIGLHLPLGDASDSFNAHPEALIRIDGQPFTTVDTRHNLLMLPPTFKDYALHDLHLEGWTGLGGSLIGDHRQLLYVLPCSVVLVDEPTRDFVALARTAIGVVEHLPPDAPTGLALLNLLTDTFATLDTRHPLGERFYQSVAAALDHLKNALAAMPYTPAFTVYAAGHAHIDTAWLWTLRHTRGKAVRTFHTALHLMDEFPAYHFSQSQPQLYDFAREDMPDLFARIQKAVEAGRWEPMGGMWVEADCNITGAESLVRQFIYGRRFIHEHFGSKHETKVLWLPDTFGFPASLPQIARGAGMEGFFTTKLRWSERNEFPYDSFWWEGLDGTRILSHITPTPMQSWLRIATYNADANAQAVIETWQRSKDKYSPTVALMAYGWGDGGGGPEPDMLENLAALDKFPGVPRTIQGKVRDFFAALREQVDERLPVWDGELYLETHQGTLTSQAWIKRANRRTEVLLHDTEFFNTAATLAPSGHTYPHTALDGIWRTLLLNQFHDILPGSSIGPVYDDSRRQFDTITAQAIALRDSALDVLAAPSADGTAYTIFNTTSFHRSVNVILPALADRTAYHTADGQPCPSQPTENGWLVHVPGGLAPFSGLTVMAAPGEPAAPPSNVSVRPDLLENDHLRARFDAAGNLIELVTKPDGWSVIAPGQAANQFQIFEDRPLRFDAWNIDPDFEDRTWLADPAHEVTVAEAGNLRASIKVVRRVMDSTITQRITLDHDSDALVFHTDIDWQERNMLLKVAFPVDIRARDATYHIQWGAVRRPTHRSSPWDAAKYEVAAHHWADIGEGGRGVTLANDCKYAYDVRGGVIRLTLLKSPTYPDPEADQGAHTLTYALRPRRIGLSGAYALGYDLNYPLVVTSGALKPSEPLVTPSANVIVETVKRSEDGRAVIVRLYEPYGTSGIANLSFGFDLAGAQLADLMEDPTETLDIAADNRRLSVPVRPFQIITLRLTPAEAV